MSNCNHQKVYSDVELMSYPPRIPWVCKICGDCGTEMKNIVNKNDYEEIFKKIQR